MAPFKGKKFNALTNLPFFMPDARPTTSCGLGNKVIQGASGGRSRASEAPFSSSSALGIDVCLREVICDSLRRRHSESLVGTRTFRESRNTQMRISSLGCPILSGMWPGNQQERPPRHLTRRARFAGAPGVNEGGASGYLGVGRASLLAGSVPIGQAPTHGLFDESPPFALRGSQSLG